MHIWEDFLKRQEEKLGKALTDKWLRTLKVLHFDACNLYLEAQGAFHVLWFEEHMRPIISKELVNNNFRPIKVHLTTQETTPGDKKPSKRTKGEKNPDKNKPTYIFHPDKIDPNATLNQFIVGEENDLAFRILMGAIEQLGTLNPLFLWGGASAGKTHLLMGLAQVLKNKGLRALYTRTETFTEHFVGAIRASSMQEFRKAYRNVDVLLVDDVHLLARKDATQEEFFHTFNALHLAKRQLIFTSQLAPPFLEDIEPRLVSRFEWGVALQIHRLSKSELAGLLEKRCQALAFELSPEVHAFLIDSFHSSQALNQALEALILRLHLKKDEEREALTKITVRELLLDLVEQEQNAALSPHRIIQVVAAHHGIRPEDILGKSQNQECSQPRQIAMFLCRTELNLPFPQIGRIFARDHSTVMTSVKQVKQRLDEHDPELLSALQRISKRLESSAALSR